MKADRTRLKDQNLTAPVLPETARVNGKRRLAAAKTAGPDASMAVQAVTQVEATIDVGWGNTLFIRGEGAGLSWDKGTPMACVDASSWVWLTTAALTRVRFKLLINDELWAGGDDQTVEPGSRIAVEPAFPSWAR